MEREEFIETAVSRGYCRADIAAEYVKDNPKEEYTDADLLEAYRFQEREREPENTFERSRQKFDKELTRITRSRKEYREEEAEIRRQKTRDSWL